MIFIFNGTFENEKLKSLNIKHNNVLLNLDTLKNRNFIYEILCLEDINFSENLCIKFILKL
nr:hypothetical protein [uncultured Tyzzerella sp.]